MSIDEGKLRASMESVKDGLAEVGERLVSVAQTIIEALGKMTPEQRMVIEFLAENPEVAEALQEMNQKLTRQRAIEGADKETAQPKEPLIKDMKIRKAVRAWAEANDITQVFYNACWDSFGFQDFMITFDHDFDRHDGLKDGQKYTIDELCGEEE